MSTFENSVKDDTPRLVVMFRRGPDGGEQFQWGVVGAMPILTLIGYIARIQSDLVNELAEERNSCPHLALVVARTEGEVMPLRTWDWWVHPDIPVDPLVGMLDTIKAALIDSRTAQQALAQRTQLLGPDGKPFPFRS